LWPGSALIPRQHSTADKARLLGISKSGSVYVRRMFIHGGRAMLPQMKYDTGRSRRWANQLELRAPRNEVVVESPQTGDISVFMGWL
jgi:transposase